MGLKSLLLCSDEKIVRVLRRVLSDLEIDVDLCPNADAALRKLTRQRFEGIIADLADEGAIDVLRSARAAPCNKQAVAVAIVEPAVGLRAAFELGAHFVLYRPVSSERAKSSFRAARALMKRTAAECPGRCTDSGGHAKFRSRRKHEGDHGRFERRRHGGGPTEPQASERALADSFYVARDERVIGDSRRVRVGEHEKAGRTPVRRHHHASSDASPRVAEAEFSGRGAG